MVLYGGLMRVCAHVAPSSVTVFIHYCMNNRVTQQRPPRGTTEPSAIVGDGSVVPYLSGSILAGATRPHAK